MNDRKIFKPRAAIFDMDGLMLDTERPMLAVWVNAGKTIGWNITEEIAIRTIGLNGEDIRKLCMDEFGADFPYDKFEKILFRLFDEEFENGITHKAGLLDILNHLASLKIPMAVATSTYRDSAFRKLAIAGIKDYFSFSVCGDEISNGKPAPDIFLKAVEKLGIPATDCVGFEDSIAGLTALAAAGIPSVFIKDIIEPPKEILATVWKRLDNLAEAISLF